MAGNGDIFFDFDNGLHKVGYFLQDILRKELLTPEAETCRQECIRYLQEMYHTLTLIKQNDELSLGDGKLINLGLSQSSQTLNQSEDFVVAELQRSGSLPNIPTAGETEQDSWGSGKAKSRKDFEPDINLNAMRQIVIYDPIEEEEEEEEEGESCEEEGGDPDRLNVSNSSRVSLKRSRKRDSAVLFDISLGDLEGAADLSGILTEKHSCKEWWCVLMDQHLCLFPSRDPEELAYDVVIMPCCQISLDDRLMRTPVFRLTQPGMTPWVMVAKDNEELKEWVKALTVAASGGKYSVTQENPHDSWRGSGGGGGCSMHAINEEEGVEELTNLHSITGTKPSCDPIEEQEEEVGEQTAEEKEDEQEKKEEEVDGEVNGEEKQESVLSPPDSDETFGEDIYEAIGTEDMEDDGFATDEFESGPSDNDNASPKSSPRMQRKTKKKNQLFKWLKKKTKAKDRLFSSPQDGVALAGYVSRLENNTPCKRWCVIREGKLYCYKTIKDEETEQTLDLDGAEIRAKEEDKNKFIIRVMKDNERLIALAAKNTRDMERWKTALRIESGFIKLAMPGDTSSGIYDDDDADYVTPMSPVGLQRMTNGHARTITLSECEDTSETQGTDDIYEENAYVEVVLSVTDTTSEHEPGDQEKFGPLRDIPTEPNSPDPECLGPLPPIPPDTLQPPALPPSRRSPLPPQWDIHENESDSEESEEFEDIYEEVPQASADKQTPSDKGKADEAETRTKGPIAAGVEDGSVSDEAMSASSYQDEHGMAHLARLNSSDGAWCALDCDRNQYLQIDLGAVTKVCGVATQGRSSFSEGGGWFVKTYTLSYSKNQDTWKSYKEYGIAKAFQGNCDPDGVVTNMFKVAVKARYVRVRPQTWHNHIAMRVELYKGATGSKLTAGIHKLAGSITKAGKNMLHPHEMKPISPEPTERDARLNTPPSPRKPRAVSFDEKLKTSIQKPPLTRKVSFDDKVKVINEHLLPSLKQDTVTEKDGKDSADTTTTKTIEVQGESDTQTDQSKPVTNGDTGGPEMSPTEKEVRSLPVRTLKQSWVKEDKDDKHEPDKEKEILHKKEGGESFVEPDKEREILRKKEEEFLAMAKQLNQEGSAAVRGKRGSIVAKNRITFENRNIEAGKENRIITKSQALLKEKSELVARMEAQKRRVNVAKDRKIFFSLTANCNSVAAGAETEFHESQLELARAKKRIAEIDVELKSIRLLDLKHQTVVIPLQTSPKQPRRVTIPVDSEANGSAERRVTIPVDSEANGSTEHHMLSPRLQRGSVLSQIKAFEQLGGKR